MIAAAFGALAVFAAPPAVEAQDIREAAARASSNELDPSGLDFAREEASPWVSGALALATLVSLDAGARDMALASHGDVGDAIAEAAERPGDWHVSVPVVTGASLLLGGVLDGGRGVEKGLAVIMGMAAGSMANEGLNQLVGRSRPMHGQGAFHFDPLSGHGAFPSGHTALVFSIAGSVDAVTESEVVALAGYGVATLTGWSRMYHDRHWASDVVAGALIGALVGREAAEGAARLLGVAEAPADATGGDGSARLRAHVNDSRRPRVRFVATPAFVGVRITP